jgi:Kef-type K+ transport system membrane component KefB
LLLFAADEGVTALRKLHLEHLILPVLIQLVIIVVVARLFGLLARKLGQPTVVGEVIAGLLLGPSLFGWLSGAAFQAGWLPLDLSAAVFQPHLPDVPADLANAAFPKIFQTLSQLGLIFLLFLVGLEFDFGHLKVKKGAAVAVALAGIALPFALGVGLAPVIHPVLEPHPEAGPVPLFGLTLFMGVAMSITAMPVLARILLEFGITRTRIGVVAMAAAAIGDAVGWVLLASVKPVARLGTDGFSPVATGTMIGLGVAFALGMFFVARPLLTRYLAWSMKRSGGALTTNALAVLLAGVLLSAVTTNLIGISAIFGAFLFGVILSDRHEVREAVTARLWDFVTTFFLPIYFTYTGLRTDVGSLGGLWWVAAVVLLAAVAGKFGGCAVAARLTGFKWKEAGVLGALMNTRGLMELIVINIGYDLGVIPKSLYCALVLMAVATTMMAGPLVVALRRNTEIEAPLQASGFGKPAVRGS